MLPDVHIAANPSSTGSPPLYLTPRNSIRLHFLMGFPGHLRRENLGRFDTTKASFPKLCRDPHRQCDQADEVARPGIGARMSEIDGDSCRAAHDDCRVAAVDVQQAACKEAAVGDGPSRELLDQRKWVDFAPYRCQATVFARDVDQVNRNH